MDASDLKGLYAEVRKKMDAAVEHVRRELAASIFLRTSA